MIDVEIIKNIKNCSNIEAINELFSDHIPIKLTIKNSEIQLNETNSFLNGNKADWKKIPTFVSEKIDLNKSRNRPCSWKINGNNNRRNKT